MVDYTGYCKLGHPASMDRSTLGGGSVKTLSAAQLFSFLFLAVLFLPGTLHAAKANEAVDTTCQQRAHCDAQCRENYQNSASALQACLRQCSSTGPATPETIAANPNGTIPASNATTVKSGKSNSSERTATVKGSKTNSSERLAATPAGPPPTPVEASNLNLSKSNVDRQQDSAAAITDDEPAESGECNPEEAAAH
jgi:hypothetical protein